ncbi:MAG TPA: tRNA pseudouridine(55) synthase TruB [Bacteroidales bacterium]|nr:tRNA pseudouridine(55) synthase TruB [Bacteroidales bacterium]HSA44524.1 tRNA pseudouridine(55) synthase TruB [Bacteroidales bacterium]
MEEPLQQGQFFLIDKPYGWTSFDVVSKMKGFIKHQMGIPKIKIGHAGTLDPLATGLLIVCTGKQTRQIEQFQALEKEYTGTFYLGMTTPSYDLEKEPDTIFPTDHLSRELMEEAALKLSGDQMQLPPVFSAVKVGGKRLYEYARKQKDVTLTPRPVKISVFELGRLEMPELDFRVICSKGTYIRALARDFGQACGSGAYLLKLCRTRIGPYSLNEALSIAQWSALMEGKMQNL